MRRAIRKLGCSAALIAAVAACGGPTRSDAGAVVASSTAPVEPVQVVVTRRARPVGGAHVVYGDADGTVVAVDRTGVEGTAVRRVAAGGMVTVVDASRPDEITTRYTIIGVEPGDELSVDRERQGFADSGTAVVDLPGAFPGAAYYDVDIGCRRFVTDRLDVPVRIGFGAPCLGSGGALAVRATALSDRHEPLAYSLRQRVSTRGESTVSVQMPAWRDEWDSFHLTLANPPADATSVALQCTQSTGGREFDVPMQLSSLQGRPVGFTFLTTPGFGESMRVIAMVTFGVPVAPRGIAFYVRRVEAGTKALDIDLGDALLPAISSVTMSPIRTDRPEVSWVAEGDLSVADGGILRLAWTVGTGAAARDHEWWIVIPPGSASPLRVPALPDQLAAFRPGPTAEFEPPRILFLEAEGITDYRHMRNRASAGIFSSAETFELPGAMRITFGGGTH